MGEYETDQELFEALSAPFPAAYVDWRIGPTNKNKNGGKASKGQPLIYIDARTVMDRLDTTCGMEGWQCNYSAGTNGSVVCNLGIRSIAGDWIWKADGAGHTDMEAEKGMLSDAFKRAAVRFGIGRYLYDIKCGWIDLDDRGCIPDAAMKNLVSVYEDACKTIGWGERPGIQAYRLLKKIVGEFVTDAGSAQKFKTDHAPEIALLPVAMKRHLFESLDRIGGTTQEAA
jgi:hypothetical protein